MKLVEPAECERKDRTGALAAVLSFLRQEGDPYRLVTQRAGEYAAQWTFDSLSNIERSIIRAMPVAMRARLAMRLARKVVHRTYRDSRARRGCDAAKARSLEKLCLHGARAVRMAVVRVLRAALARPHPRQRRGHRQSRIRRASAITCASSPSRCRSRNDYEIRATRLATFALLLLVAASSTTAAQNAGRASERFSFFPSTTRNMPQKSTGLAKPRQCC